MLFSTADEVVDGVPVLRVLGEIDISVAPRLTAALNELLARSDRAAVVDLTEVTFFDSSGLKSLDDARLASADRGLRFEIVCPPGKVLRLLEMTGVDDLFTIHPTVEKATAATRD